MLKIDTNYKRGIYALSSFDYIQASKGLIQFIRGEKVITEIKNDHHMEILYLMKALGESDHRLIHINGESFDSSIHKIAELIRADIRDETFIKYIFMNEDGLLTKKLVDYESEEVARNVLNVLYKLRNELV